MLFVLEESRSWRQRKLEVGSTAEGYVLDVHATTAQPAMIIREEEK